MAARLFIIFVLLFFFSGSCHALVIENFDLVNYEYQEQELSKVLQESVVSTVYDSLKLDVLQGVPLNIIYSDKVIKGINGTTFRHGGMYYIVMAHQEIDYFGIIETFLHEVGHVVMYHYKINLEWFSLITDNDYSKGGSWGDRMVEKFAESFKMWIAREKFKRLGYANYFKYKVNGDYTHDKFSAIMWMYQFYYKLIKE